MSLSKYRQHEHIIALPVSALTWGRLGSSWRDGDPRSDRIAHHISPGETLLQHLAISLSFDFPLITFYSPALLQNAGVFRELGGASLAGKLVHHADTRDAGLGLLQQLVVAGGILPCLHFDLFFSSIPHREGSVLQLSLFSSNSEIFLIAF